MGEWLLSPEGQVDSNQARSALEFGHLLGDRSENLPQRDYRTQPRVSTLGTVHPERRALKGRQIERSSNVEVRSNCDTFQSRTLIFAQR
jgi:hypothetical protein